VADVSAREREEEGLVLARLPRRRPPHTLSLASTTRSRGGRRICGRCTVPRVPRGPPAARPSPELEIEAELGEGSAGRGWGQQRKGPAAARRRSNRGRGASMERERGMRETEGGGR
jgi:hypothetical protein